jgi:copper chaperone CopZ
MTSVILSVPEISCAHCASSIVEALSPESGVSKVSVDVEGQKVLLDFDDATISLDRVKEILLAEEYPVEGVEFVAH